MVYKRLGFPNRTLRLEVRVGNTLVSKSHGLKPIVANTRCDYTSPSRTSMVSSAYCIPQVLIGEQV